MAHLPPDPSAFGPNGPRPSGQWIPQSNPTGAWGTPPPVPPAPRKSRKWPVVVGVAVVLVVGVAAFGSTGDRVGAGVNPSSTPTTTSTSTAVRATTTSAKATTTKPPPPPPSVFTGVGDDVITVDRPVGIKIVQFECPACSGNTVLKSDGFESLLVNEIGAYRGTKWMDIRDGSRTSTLTVNATGSWTVTVGELDLAERAQGPMSGTGDAVLFFLGSSKKVRITNTGESNFAVHAVSLAESRIELLVNHIGGYEGTVPLSGPAIIQVTSSGNWTITPS